MSDLRLSIDHDIDLTNQNMSLTEDGDESIAQRLKIMLLLFKGEYFLNDLVGIPYFQEIFVKGTTKEQVDFIYKQAIQSTPGILELIDYSSDFDRTTRLFSLNFKARTETGTSSFEVTV